MVAPRSAPHSSSSAMTSSPSSAAAFGRVHLDGRGSPTQSSAYAATPLASSRPSSVVTSAVTTPVVADDGDVEAGQSRRRRASGGRRRRRRAGRRCRGRGSPAPSRGRGTARPRPSPAARRRSAAGPAPRSGRPPARSRPSTPDGPIASTELARRAVDVAGPAQQPVAQRLGLQVRPQRQRPALGLGGRDPVPGRRARRDRLAGDDVARARMVTGSAARRRRARSRRPRRPTTCRCPARRSSPGRRSGRSRPAAPGVRRPAGPRHADPRCGHS